MADFKIAYDGTWFHEGVRIQRNDLAKLFADRALKVDGEGNYWLQTPFEKYPVEVEDVPFVVVDYTEQNGGLDFMTNMGDTVAMGPENPLELRKDKKSGDLLPYVQVRGGLYARLSRPIYYNLAQRFGKMIESRGGTFPLGEIND